MELSPKVYTEKRNELLQILKPVSQYEELDMASKTAFNLSIGKLQSESFEIVLVGEFQGGKSTTFNAICDGRCISPMGFGIKTSACKISAQNIVDPTEKERAIVQWKSDDDLILTVLNIVRSRLSQKDYEPFTKRDNNGHFTDVSLDDPACVSVINKCLADEWEQYTNRRTDYDRDLEGKLDMLYIASICMHFRNDPYMKNLRKETVVATINEMQAYVKFPVDWATRWSEGKPDAFKVEEVVFAFVADVYCHLHSPNLQRLGCVVTDCPGLFAGPWDTKVAIDAMLQADAILYLLPGINAIGMKELGALKAIQRSKQLHKVFFTMNARVSYDHLTTVIRPTNASNINNCLGEGTSDNGHATSGTLVQPEDIAVFNSLLAYNSKRFASLQAAGDETALKEWRKETRKAVANFLNLDTEDDSLKINNILDHPEQMAKECRYVQLLDTIETMVVQKKACSLLYTTGVIPVNDALEALEGKLQIQEDDARSGYQDAQQKANEARQILEEFKQESTQVVEDEFDDSAVVAVLSDDFVKQVYLERTSAIASNIMQNIETILHDTKESMKYLFDIVKRKMGYTNETEKGFAKTIKGFVSKSIEEECIPAAKGWLTNVTQGNNAVYKTSVGSKLKNISFRINQLWKELVLAAPEGVRKYFQGLKPSVKAEQAAGEITNSFDGSGLLEEIRGSMLRMLMANIVATIGGTIAGMVAGLVAALLLGVLFAGTFTLPILIAGTAISVFTSLNVSDWIQDKFSQKIRDNLSAKLKPELDNAFRKPEIQRSLKESAGQIAQKLVEAHKKFYLDDLERLSAKFQERYDDMEKNRKKSQAELKAIADHAKHVREEIATFRVPIQRFIEGVRPYFE
ncbi:MAG: hypothetical protein Q4G59_00250 [Planctomycetia bacterium]|nr:hypothetical protein [Planctomycetia bacterium]